MGSGLQLNEVLNRILKLSVEEMKAQQGSILLFNEHQDRLEMLAAFSISPRRSGLCLWVQARPTWVARGPGTSQAM